MEVYKRSIRILKTPIITILVVLIGSACNNSITKEELTKYVNNPQNGLIHQFESSKINYHIIYQPAKLLFEQDTAAIYDSLLYFELTMKAKPEGEIIRLIKNPNQYKQLITNLNHGLPGAIQFITSDKDTIMPYITHYTPTYNLDNSTKLLIVVKNQKLLESDEFDMKIAGIPPVDFQRSSFHFKTKDIRKIRKKL